MTREEIEGLLPGTIFACGGYSGYEKAPWYAVVRKGWDGKGMVIDEFYRNGDRVISPGYYWVPDVDEPAYVVYVVPLVVCGEEW